jgi:hypothetical protein
MIVQAVWFGFTIGEISCPTRYFPEASSINFFRSVVYGIGVLNTSLRYRMQKLGWGKDSLFNDAESVRLLVE